MLSRKILIRISVFFASAAAISLELLQVRLMSYLYWANFVYATVGIAMVGAGISGVLICLASRQGKFPVSTSMASLFLALFSLSTVLCLHYVSLSPPALESWSLWSKLTVVFLILAIPFLFSGAAISILLMLNSGDMPSLYAFDMIASSIGVLSFILLLRPLGAEGLVVIVVSLGLLSSIACVVANDLRSSWVIPLAASPLLVVHLLGANLFGVISDSHKPVGKRLGPEQQYPKIEHTEWTPIARIDILKNVASEFGSSPRKNSTPESDNKVVTQDGTGWTPLISAPFFERIRNEPNDKKRILQRNILYALRRPQNALVIGVGGGIDLLSAWAWGAKSVDGVEINPATYDIIRHHLPDLLTADEQSRIQLHLGEGRYFVNTAKNSYDSILVGGVDTYAAPTMGNAFSENYLYTVEALVDFLNAITPDGIVGISRNSIPQTQGTRLVMMFMEAAAKLGLEHPEKCLFVTGVPTNSLLFANGLTITTNLFFKKTPFLPEEIESALERLKPVINSQKLIYVPPVLSESRMREVRSEFMADSDDAIALTRKSYMHIVSLPERKDRNDFAREQQFNVSPVYDDNPFFFNIDRLLPLHSAKAGLGSLQLLQLTLALVFVLLMSIFGPLLAFAKDGLAVAQSRRWCAIVSLLGFGFMFAELGFMQFSSLYLEGPIYSISTILAGLMCFSGLGSWLSAQKFRLFRLSLTKALLLSGFSIWAWLLILKLILPATMSWPFSARVFLILLALAPTGIFLGTPFVNVLKNFERTGMFVPWLWGINGITSVIATFAVLLLAPQVGISGIILIAGGCYLLAFRLVPEGPSCN